MPKHLPKDISERLRITSEDLASSWIQDISCEIEEHGIVSPIEQQFYLAWRWMDAKGGCIESDGRLVPQYRIGRYTVDFLVDPIRPFVDYPHRIPDSTLCALADAMPKIVIELDGHDFHEKSRDQVARDKKRERHLIQQGYTVVRFSGSEVFKDAEACVDEVNKLLGKTMPAIRRRFVRGEFVPVA